MRIIYMPEVLTQILVESKTYSNSSASTAAREKGIEHALFFHILGFCHTFVEFLIMNGFSTWQTIQNQIQ